MGALFDTLDKHATTWTKTDREARTPVGRLDDASPPDLDAPALDSAGPGATFCRDVRHLGPVLAQILAAATFGSLSAIADESGTAIEYDDATWFATLCDFLAAYHRGVMDRTHIVRALMPLYLGRVASFIGKHSQSPIAEIELDLERLSQQFERERQYLIERRHRTT